MEFSFFQEKVLEYSSFLDHQAKNPTEILDFIFTQIEFCSK